MALNIDYSKAFRTPLQLKSLVEAVAVAGEHDESDWIEWKSTYNLSEKQTKSTLARHILAMANRSVEKSAQTAGGCGYILVGVEPGSVSGVSTIDLADLESGVRPYLGPQGPEWIPSYVAVAGEEVLVISVDPPKDGDPIHTLHKDFDRYQAGLIFVRRTAQTVIAGPGEVLRLTQRAQSSEERQSLSVESIENPVKVPSWPWLDEKVRALVQAESEILEAGNKKVRPRDPLGLSINFDTRSQGDYMKEAEKYLRDYETYVLDLARQSYMRRNHGLLRLRIENFQERSYQQVRMEIALPEGISAFLADDYSDEEFEAPYRPKPLGEKHSLITGSFAGRGIITARHVPDVHMFIENETLLCDVVSLRAEETLDLPLIHLMTSKESDELSLVLPWSITAVNALGRTRGHLQLRIDGVIEELPEGTSE
ncbi:ATP-binding protein [Streptomyces brevispora]|uniref:AlbA family DNA-binding domain-containing protein n=1 Tax=Streptomyces brevispora TaxID=887462 RepID=UPI0033F26ABA